MDTRTLAATRNIWSRHAPAIERLFAEAWLEPELPGMEVRSAARLADWLEAQDFAVERKAAGIPTAFVASRRLAAGGPRIDVLAEYDALPGLDNAPTCERRPLGLRAGHACGHNHIGPSNTGAAIAAAEAAASLGLAGEIRLVGCPAEEILWGKIALLKHGVFQGTDAVLTSHGDYQTGALSRPCSAAVSGEFVFQGEAGHGGMVARSNALDGAELALQTMDRLRVNQFADAAIKHVFRTAGIMPSITPDEVRLWITARSLSMERAQACYAMARAACEQAAALTATQVRHQFISESRGYLANDALGRALFAALETVGAPRWSENDLAFMRALSATCAPGRPMTLDRGMRYYDTGADYYGQDDGEISWRVPLGRVNWAYPPEVPIHHWAWTALSGHAASSPGPLMASEALAIAAVRLLSEPELVERAQAELRERTAGYEITEPRLGAWRTLTTAPETFWSATWVE